VICVVAGLRDELQSRHGVEERGIEARALADRDYDRIFSEAFDRHALRVHVDRNALAKALNGGVGLENPVVVVQDSDP
jgi:hypothetical protein